MKKIYRFVDYAFTLYIAPTTCRGFNVPSYLLLRYKTIYWISLLATIICQTLAVGFTLLWAYGLFRGYGKVALLFRSASSPHLLLPFIPIPMPIT